MNVFRFAGDMLHLLSILFLVLKLEKGRSCVGISSKTQELYLIVFLTRYVDLFFSFVSIYNTVMKTIFIASTAYLVYLMRFHKAFTPTYDAELDSFSYIKYLLGPCMAMALITTEDYGAQNIFWTFSIWLEAVAILPQLVLFRKARELENLTSTIVFCMGLYRFLYILNWIFRFMVEGNYNYIAWVGGIIQTGLYCDFFYYYALSKWYGEKLILPMSA